MIYVKGGGQRPTHNYSPECADVSKLSRLVVLMYTDMGMGDMSILTPLTVSLGNGDTADSPTYLFLRQEELVTSLDALCPNPIENTMPIRPGLSMLTVSSKLTDPFFNLQGNAAAIAKAVETLIKDSRKRRKPGEDPDVEGELDVEEEETVASDVRARLGSKAAATARLRELRPDETSGRALEDGSGSA